MADYANSFERYYFAGRADAAFLCGVVLVRAVNLLIARLRFHQWGMLHTWGNKAAGLLLYLLPPVCILLREIPAAIAAVLFTAAYFSAVEETVILFTEKRYQANRKSLFIREKE